MVLALWLGITAAAHLFETSTYRAGTCVAQRSAIQLVLDEEATSSLDAESEGNQ